MSSFEIQGQQRRLGRRLSRQDQTHVRGYRLLHQSRERLSPAQATAFEEAVIMRAALPHISCPRKRLIVSRRIEARLGILMNAILIGAHVRSGHGVQSDVQTETNRLFWANNINHAATHQRAKFS